MIFITLFLCLLIAGYISKTYIRNFTYDLGEYYEPAYRVFELIFVIWLIFGLPDVISSITFDNILMAVVTSYIALFVYHYFMIRYLIRNTALPSVTVADLNILNIAKRGWLDGRFYFASARGIVVVKPFQIWFLDWSDIYKIFIRRIEANTVDALALYFEFGDRDSLSITELQHNFENISKKMIENFSMISKDWKNHVFHADGRFITLYSRNDQAY